MRQIFDVDLRSLALGRMGIGLCLLLDLVIRAFDLSQYYSDRGLFSSEELIRFARQSGVYSFHLLARSLPAQIFLFLVGALIYALLATGYRTRFATVLSWIFLVSLENASPALGRGGSDYLLSAVLVVGMFIPWGARYSLDETLHGSPAQNAIRTWGTAYFMLVLFSLWFGAGFAKTRETWLTSGEAAYFAFSWEETLTYFGKAISRLPDGLLRASSRAVYFLEVLAPIFFFWPFRNGPVRTVSIALLILLQLQIAWSLRFIELFPPTNIFFLLMLLPSWFWDRASGWGAAMDRVSAAFRQIARKTRLRISRRAAPKGVGHLGVAGRTALLALFVYSAWDFLDGVGAVRWPDWAAFLPQTGTKYSLRNDWRLVRSPEKHESWFKIEGTSGSRTVDLVTGRDVGQEDLCSSENRPYPIAGTFKNYRQWVLYQRFFYTGEMLVGETREYRARLARRICTSHSYDSVGFAHLFQYRLGENRVMRPVCLLAERWSCEDLIR